MTVWHFKYVPDVFHFNALFCFYSDDCEAFKSVGSNSVTELCVKKELLKGLHIYVCIYIYDVYIYIDIYLYIYICTHTWSSKESFELILVPRSFS